MPKGDRFLSAASETAALLEACRADRALLGGVDRATACLVRCLREDGRVFACGNGGSMSDAMHFTEELCGRFRETRPALGALAFSDPATLTCIANDFGFEEVFARQIEAQGRPGDVLVLLSTSGNSPNVVRAAQAARATGVETIGLLGRGGGNAATEIDVPIVVPWAKTAERIQEAHLLILHTFVESIEGALFPGSAGRR